MKHVRVSYLPVNRWRSNALIVNVDVKGGGGVSLCRVWILVKQVRSR